jgi:hypothetical protein
MHGDRLVQVAAQAMHAREIVEHGRAEAMQLRPPVERATHDARGDLRIVGRELEADVEGLLVVDVVAGVERFGPQLDIAPIATPGERARLVVRPKRAPPGAVTPCLAG